MYSIFILICTFIQIFKLFSEPTEETHDPCENWEEIDDNFDLNNNSYEPKAVDLEKSTQIIKRHSHLEIIDPFNAELKAALLEKIQFYHKIEHLDDGNSICELVNKVVPIKNGKKFSIKGNHFEIMKQIGRGSFGTIYW